MLSAFSLTNADEDEDCSVVEVCEGRPDIDQAAVSCQSCHHGREHPGKPDPRLRARDILDKMR